MLILAQLVCKCEATVTRALACCLDDRLHYNFLFCSLLCFTARKLRKRILNMLTLAEEIEYVLQTPYTLSYVIHLCSVFFLIILKI